MKVSYNWLKDLLNFPYSPEELDAVLTETGLEVECIEHIEDIKGGLKGVKPSRKNSFRNEAVKRGITSGQLANRVIANPSRYKGINPKSAQLVRNMGVRKEGGSIGDILRSRRGM